MTKTDFSDYISSEVLFQLGKCELSNLITFFSKNIYSAKYNYDIYDKKLLVII